MNMLMGSFPVRCKFQSFDKKKQHFYYASAGLERERGGLDNELVSDPDDARLHIAMTTRKIHSTSVDFQHIYRFL